MYICMYVCIYICMYVYICELFSLRLAEHWRKFDPDFTIDPVYEVMTVIYIHVYVHVYRSLLHIRIV